MLEIDSMFLSHSFHSMTGLPIRYYKNNNLAHMLPIIQADTDPIGQAMPILVKDPFYISYCMTPDFLFYGKIEVLNTSGTFFIGPGYSVPLSRRHISDIMINSAISHQKNESFTDFICKIPLISFEIFLNALCFFNFSINRTKMTAETLISQGNPPNDAENGIKSALTETMYNAKEQSHFHNTYNLEQQILTCIRTGNTGKLNEMFNHSVRAEAGPVAKDALRQAKNIFVISATIVTRAAIDGGLDIETSFHLSDIYIQQAESLSRLDAIALLQQQMVIDFAERVSAHKYPPELSPAIVKCMRYIQNYINAPILIHDVANEIGMNASYFSTKFKKEMGISLNEYINRQKIEEAKNLLAFSNKSLSEISSYLSFSSQSYFQNLFKKNEGMTPLTYRNSFQKRK